MTHDTGKTSLVAIYELRIADMRCFAGLASSSKDRNQLVRFLNDGSCFYYKCGLRTRSVSGTVVSGYRGC
jgi:hypothetical protein